MYLPIPFTKPRKWMRVVIRAVEKKWFDDFGKFYTYVLKNAEIIEVIDEEELVEDMIKTVKAWLDEGYTIDQLRERIILAYGIPDAFVDELLERVKVELGLVKIKNVLEEP